MRVGRQGPQAVASADLEQLRWRPFYDVRSCRHQIVCIYTHCSDSIVRQQRQTEYPRMFMLSVPPSNGVGKCRHQLITSSRVRDHGRLLRDVFDLQRLRLRHRLAGGPGEW